MFIYSEILQSQIILIHLVVEIVHISPLLTMLSYLNFHPLKVGQDRLYWYNLKQHICKS